MFSGLGFLFPKFIFPVCIFSANKHRKMVPRNMKRKNYFRKRPGSIIMLVWMKMSTFSFFIEHVRFRSDTRFLFLLTKKDKGLRYSFRFILLVAFCFFNTVCKLICFIAYRTHLGRSQYTEIRLCKDKGGICRDWSASTRAKGYYWFVGIVDSEVWKESWWHEGIELCTLKLGPGGIFLNDILKKILSIVTDFQNTVH